MNYSRQREIIYKTLRQTVEHPTAETVHGWLKKENPSLSLATVYRNLNQMCEAGMVRRLKVPDSPDRYDGDCTAHNHLACSCCGVVVDIEQSEAFRQCYNAAVANLRHKVEGFELVLYGICENCLKSQS